MKRLLIIAALSGCAGLTPQGRYMQVVVADVVGLQFTLPSQAVCATAVSQSGPAAPMMRCSPVSASQNLPARATLRDKAFGYTYDIEATTQDMCERAVISLTTSPNVGSTELVAACKTK